MTSVPLVGGDVPASRHGQTEGRRLRVDVDNHGMLRFSDEAGEHLFTVDTLRYTAAEIHQLEYGINHTRVRLRSTEGLTVGDTVELRNEFQDGRANQPIVHRCTVTEIEDEFYIHIDRPSEVDAIRKDRGAYLWKTRGGSIDDLVVTTSRETAEMQYWQVAGESDDLRVRLSIHHDISAMRLDVFAERAYLAAMHIVNERLALLDLPPLATVFRKNRQVRKHAFSSDMWLDRQGASFSDGRENHVLVQHAPRVSSLRLTKVVPAHDLVPASTFFAAPHDLAAAATFGGPYASAVTRPGEPLIFDVAFAEPVDVRGLRLTWLTAASKPTAVAMRALHGKEQTAHEIFACDPDTIADDLVLSSDAMCDRLRLEVTPGTILPDGRGRVFLNHVAPSFGSRGFSLAVNLDDHRDHRFYSHLEYERRNAILASRVTENLSAYRRVPGDVASSTFSVHLAPPPDFDLRVMHVPHGYDAMLLWTEHADASTVERHRAAYFGRSDISRVEDAVGGFVGWGIPVTKSVFFDNPDALPPRPGMATEQVALSSSPGFWDFCKQLEAAGNEVCLHSDQPQNSSPESVAAAIDQFYASFRSRSWIDHSPLTVHGGASGQGTRRGSRYYAVPRWLHHGVRYFWCVGNEDYTMNDVQSGLDVLEARSGDDRITPLYWEHEQEAPGLVLWSALRGGRADIYTDDSIEQLIRNRGVCVNHTYPAAIYPSSDLSRRYIETASDGSARTTAVFETVLRTIATARDAGRLLPTTVTKALDYLLQLHDVRLEFRPGNHVVISNQSNADIEGFSFAAAGGLEVVGDFPGLASRMSAGDVLVTFTLQAQAMVVVRRDGGTLRVSAPPTGDDRAEG
jgi:hypothetical protein